MGISLRSIPTNIVLNPSAGSGDANIIVTQENHFYGRVARQSQATCQALDGSGNVTLNITEAANPLTIWLNVASVVVPAEGDTVIISGYTNAEYLTFNVLNDTIGIPAITTWSASGVNVNNGSGPSGDPGAFGRYTFSCTINIPAHSVIEEKTATIQIIPDGVSGSQQTFLITQSEANPYLWINAENQTTYNITLAQDGSGATVRILSNTNWSFEIV